MSAIYYHWFLPMLDNIRVVLIRTYHPGNIGASLRALKTMGLSRLYLVSPQQWPHSDATSMAAGAADLLETVTVVETLEEAIGDCSLVLGTSARNRTCTWPHLRARQAGQKITEEAPKGQVAIVFGQETMGMTNEELQQCNYHVSIPANPDYPVLNVAAAVQTLCYEIRQSYEDAAGGEDSNAEVFEAIEAYPEKQDMERFYKHLEQALNDIHFIIPQHPGAIMTKLRRLFNRARPEQHELGILRGILSRVQENAGKK